MNPERRISDDLKWALGVLAGCVLGFVAFGADDASILLGALAGVTLVLVARGALRRRRRASRT